MNTPTRNTSCSSLLAGSKFGVLFHDFGKKTFEKLQTFLGVQNISNVPNAKYIALSAPTRPTNANNITYSGLRGCTVLLCNIIGWAYRVGPWG